MTASVDLPCSNPGRDGTFAATPRHLADDDFDEAYVVCDDCMAADPFGERCVRCANPLTDTSELIDNTCRSCFVTARPASVPPGFFPDRDVIDWELFWMRLLNRYETAVERMGRLMDEAIAGYDADADLHASWEIAPA